MPWPVKLFGGFVFEMISSVQQGREDYWKTKPENNRKALGKNIWLVGGDEEGEDSDELVTVLLM